MKTVLTFAGGLALLIVGAWFVFTFVLISEEERIHRLVYQCKRGVEGGSIVTFANAIAPEYSDRSGADRARVLQALRMYFDATSSRTVQIYHVDIEVQEDRADVDVECRLNAGTASTGHAMLPRFQDIHGRRIHIRLELTKQKQQWKLVYTDFQPLM